MRPVLIAEIFTALLVGFMTSSLISAFNCERLSSRYVFEVKGADWILVILVTTAWILFRVLTHINHGKKKEYS